MARWVHEPVKVLIPFAGLYGVFPGLIKSPYSFIPLFISLTCSEAEHLADTPIMKQEGNEDAGKILLLALILYVKSSWNFCSLFVLLLDLDLKSYWELGVCL